jgi:hypothetical protein
MTGVSELTLRKRGLPQPKNIIQTVCDSAPQLLVMIDTEEEFDWSQPFDRQQTGVKHIEDVPQLQAVFERIGLIPTYILDYPIAASDSGRNYFRALAQSGRAEIGMHLHPWVTPPHEEVVNSVNSYGCNLSADLERRKLNTLYEVIAAQIGITPTLFKAGRYGAAHDTIDHLRSLGIFIDTSSMPAFDLGEDGGPDYSRAVTQSHWLDTPFGRILEIPTTGAFVGLFHAYGPSLLRIIQSPLARKVRLSSIFSRLNLLSRIRLSPEGYSLDEMKQLTRALHKRGDRVFSLSLHSPSAGIGFTPYVRSLADRDRLFNTIEGYVAWFRTELGGMSTTPSAILAEVSR